MCVYVCVVCFSRITAGNCAVSGVAMIPLLEDVTKIQTQKCFLGNQFCKTEQNFIFAADNILLKILQNLAVSSSNYEK